MPYPFLSDEWIEAARELRAALVDEPPPITHPMRMNLVVTEIPFGQDSLEAHIDTTAGDLDIDKGHLDDPDLTVTIDYGTAKSIFVDRNAQAGMQAFMAGKVRVEGDMAKLIALQSAPPNEHVAERLRSLTE